MRTGDTDKNTVVLCRFIASCERATDALKTDGDGEGWLLDGLHLA